MSWCESEAVGSVRGKWLNNCGAAGNADFRKGRNCQSWVQDYVAWLVERKLVDKVALEALENAPRI